MSSPTRSTAGCRRTEEYRMLNTAKSVLAMNRNEIIERADLEEQTVDDHFSYLIRGI